MRCDDGVHFGGVSAIGSAIHWDRPELLDLFAAYCRDVHESRLDRRRAMYETLQLGSVGCLNALMDRGISPYEAADDPFSVQQRNPDGYAAFYENLQRRLESQPACVASSAPDVSQPSIGPGRF